MEWAVRVEPQPIADMNTTPLIDVLLVLLITLIITMPLMTHAVKVDVRGGGSSVQREIVNIEIEADGSIYWNSIAVADYRELGHLCRTAAGKSVQPSVRVHADRRVKYDPVAQVMSIAQRSGIKTLGIAGGERFRD